MALRLFSADQLEKIVRNRWTQSPRGLMADMHVDEIECLMRRIVEPE